MAICPLIQNLKKNGSTLIAMSSAINQEQLASNDDNIKFNFSKFACLNLPNIKTPINSSNNIQFLSIDGQIFDGLSSYNSTNLIQSLQNYALNLETILLDSNSYDNKTLKTVSERVFFKWLKEIGVLRFRESFENESITTRFVEEDEKLTGSTLYNKVVQYIGSVDIVNNVQNKGTYFSEVYLNIPSEVGNTPVVLFNTVSDNNYKPNMIIKGKDEVLYNRKITTTHPDNLSINAYYDYDTNVAYTESLNANWYNQSSTNGSVNSYFTEPTAFTDASNISITKKSADYPVDAFTDVIYKRSKLDGITIDFNSANYTDIVESNSVNSLQEYNSSLKSKNFEFNAILLYYDIYNVKTPHLKETNLYGVLFLDNLVESVSESYIPRFKKFKFNSFTNQNGNSFGLKINFKNSQSIVNSTSENLINESNTFSMSLFSDTMVQLQNSIINFQEQNKQLIELSNRVQYLEQLIYNIASYDRLDSRITELSEQIVNYNMSFNNSNVLVNMINELNNKYNRIIQNKTAIDVLINSDNLYAGKGIFIDKSVKDKIILNNTLQSYNISLIKDKNNIVINKDNFYSGDESKPELYAYLKEYSNYVKIYNYNNLQLEENLKVFIVDNNTTFENGQIFRIVFTNNINFNGKNLLIYSDYYDKFKYGKLNKLMLNIPSIELSAKPIIDIICIDKDNYILDYNIIN